MAGSTRDLTYLISFDVGDTTALGDAATDMDTLATKAGELDAAPDIDLGLPELDETPADIGAVGTALDDLETPITDANTKVGGLRGMLQDFGLTSIGVGEAIDLVGQFVNAGTQLWEAYNTKTALTKQITEGVSEAMLEQTGALDIITGELEDLVEAAGTPAEVLNASIWQGIEAEQGAEEVEKLRVALGQLGLGLDDVGGAVQSFEDFGAQFATALFQGNTSAEQFEQTLADLAAAGDIPINFPVDFAQFSTEIGQAIESGDSWGEIVAALPSHMRPLASAFEEQILAIEQLNDAQENVDYTTLMQEQLDAAAQSDTLRTALAEVKDELGEGATVPEIWQAYTEKILALGSAAEETDEALDGATEDRTGEVDVDLEQAREDAAALRGEMEEATEPRTAEVEAEVVGADDAEGDLDTVADPRTAPVDINIVQYIVALALMAALAEPRTANITANALTALANIELDNVAHDRTVTVNVATGSVSVPSESSLISRMTGGRGYIRIPVDTYPRNVARLGAAR